jgi:hypothetical protein
LDERGFRTFAALFAAVGQGTVGDAEFDDVLWLLTADRVYRHKELKELPPPVLHYFACRLVEREVGNEGFAQAAYNALDWFEAAAAGYEAIGCAQAASRIRLVAAASELEALGLGLTGDQQEEVAGVFAPFAESRVKEFDDGLDEIGWWAMERRLAYVLGHQEAFMSLDPPVRH